MKLKNAAFSLPLAIATQAHGQPTDATVETLLLSSSSTEVVAGAASFVERVGRDNGGEKFEVQLQFDARFAQVKIKRSKGILCADELVDLLRQEFGSSLNVEKVPVERLLYGTQDDQAPH